MSQSLREEISDLLSETKEDRFSCPADARKKAMDFLARREYGQAELVGKLTGKGYDREIAEQAIRELGDEGLQSDARFAESFVQSRVNQGKGPVRIRLELEQRGIEAAAIDIAIEDAGVDWHELAVGIRRKKFGAGRPADFKAKARQMRFLQYRGFEPDQVRAAVGE